MAIDIIQMMPAHAQRVLTIYKEGLDTGQATFNTEVPSWDEWDNLHHKHSRLIALMGSDILGWAALSPVSARYCYRGVAELSIYIAANNRGIGIGDLLLKNLIPDSEANGIWTLQSSVFPENTASIKLHKKHSFREIGYREKIAALHDVWRNTVLLERRSKLIE